MKTARNTLLAVCALFVLPMNAHGQSQRESLPQLVQQLQAAPDDSTLRARIIMLGATMKPAPAIPEEANRAFVKGNVFQKEAKDASGYQLAIASYRDAIRLAPWWGDAYYNLAVSRGLAEEFDRAIAAFKLYMASVRPGSAEARDAQNRIYELEASAEMAAARKSEERGAAAETPEAREAALFEKVQGARFVRHEDWPAFDSSDVFEISGRTLTLTYSLRSWRGPMTKYGIKRPGDYVIYRLPYREGAFTYRDADFAYVYRLSPDGQTLTCKNFLASEREPDTKPQSSIARQ